MGSGWHLIAFSPAAVTGKTMRRPETGAKASWTKTVMPNRDLPTEIA